MKPKEYLALIADADGFMPTPRFRWIIRKNTRKTAREEAIATEVIQQANPRENITGHYPWGSEQRMVLEQLWIHPERASAEWRPVPVDNDSSLYSIEQTEHGDLPVPNAIKEPGVVQGDFHQRIREMLGEAVVQPTKCGLCGSTDIEREAQVAPDEPAYICNSCSAGCYYDENDEYEWIAE